MIKKAKPGRLLALFKKTASCSEKKYKKIVDR